VLSRSPRLSPPAPRGRDCASSRVICVSGSTPSRSRAERQDLELPGVGIVGRLEYLVHPVLLPRGGLEASLIASMMTALSIPFSLPSWAMICPTSRIHRFFFPFPKSSTCVTSRFALRISEYGTRYVVRPPRPRSLRHRSRRALRRGAAGPPRRREVHRTRFPRDRSKCSCRRSRRVTRGRRPRARRGRRWGPRPRGSRRNGG